MSGVTHTQTPIRQRLQRDERRAKIIALCIVTTFTALLITPYSSSPAATPLPPEATSRRTRRRSRPLTCGWVPIPPRPASRRRSSAAPATKAGPRKAAAASVTSRMLRRERAVRSRGEASGGEAARSVRSSPEDGSDGGTAVTMGVHAL
jgi:hypothetical protein